MNRRRAWILGSGLTGFALLALATAWSPPKGGQGWLYPLRALVASWEWTHFHQKVGRGQWQEAYVHGRRALRWDSDSAGGWYTLADHFLFHRASAENEPNPADRVPWLVRGLHVLREGQASPQARAELLLAEGQTLTLWIAGLAEDEDLPWPGGGQAAWRLGMRRLALAAEEGHPGVARVLELAIKVGRDHRWTTSDPE